jgi:CubicO group peptidase (beta-lactamase class C family)
MRELFSRGLLGPSLLLIGACVAAPPPLATQPALDPGAQIARWMQQRGVVGLAVARIEAGEVQQVWALGQRSRERAEALAPETVLYAASLTKLAFAWMVLQLVDEGRLDLDAPLPRLLPRPLPEYAEWSDLAGDARWQRLTPRLLLSHQSGLPNWRWIASDQRLRFDHEPGTRYAYSGEGIQILQTVLEQGMGLDVDAEMRRRLFEPLGLARTALRWQPSFAPDVADGYDQEGRLRPHAQRRRARLAGSMDSSVRDQARLWAALSRGWGLSAASREQLLSPQVPIRSVAQFPSLRRDEDPALAALGLAAGLGLVVFDNGDGRGWFKGGHDDFTGNFLLCLEQGRRCVLMMSNDVRAESLFPHIATLLLGPTRMPWRWEYGATAP